MRKASDHTTVAVARGMTLHGGPIAGDARAREWLSRHLLPTPSPNSTPLHDAAVEDISGVSKVEADAETARMNRLALDALRRM